MPCYHPVDAWRDPGGKITFREYGDSGPKMQLPCGRCIGCRKKRVAEWTTRCMHESQMHNENCFITLTYKETEPSLHYEDWQTFIRKMRDARRAARQKLGLPAQTIRYFVAGEYGSKFKRPHWHALLFGTTFYDQSPIGKDLMRSPELEQLWPHGHSAIGELNWTTCGYVASYCIDKLQTSNAYTRVVWLTTGDIVEVEPERARMSLKPAIGRTWIEKYWKEVYLARDGIVKPGGVMQKAPRYYDKKMETGNFRQIRMMREKETIRQQEAMTREKDNTPERLETRERVEIAKQKQRIERKKL